MELPGALVDRADFQAAGQYFSRESAGFLRLSFARIGLLLAIASTVLAKAEAQTERRADPASFPVSAEYKVEDLGELPQIAADMTVSLNRSGTVAYWSRTQGVIRATLWQRDHVTVMDDVPGFPNTVPHGINRHGDVGGWMNTSRNPVDSLSTTRGFVRHGKRVSIVPDLGGRESRIFSLNDKNTAVGESMRPDGVRHAFVSSGSRTIDLGTLRSGSSSAAYAVNNAGVIAGAAATERSVNHAVLWRDGKIMDLGTLPHGAASSARAINDHGQIVGFSDTPDGIHAFLYTDGVMRDLGTLGSDPSEATGINNRGQVVGASNVSGTQRHAFLWQGGRMADLNTGLPQGSGWTLLKAFSINDRGQITCSARRSGGQTHLLLLTRR